MNKKVIVIKGIRFVLNNYRSNPLSDYCDNISYYIYFTSSKSAS